MTKRREMTTADYTRGLREIADWYDAHPDMTLPECSLPIYGAPQEQVSRIARALGHAEKSWSGLDNDLFVLSRHFGPIELRVLFDREAVCTRRVVGTRVVPARPAEPEREEEIVEWDCEPILGEDT